MSHSAKTGPMVQRCSYDVNCNHSDPCPHHSYEQETDPAVIPYLKQNQHFMGQTAMDLESQGKTPTSTDVRVASQSVPAERNTKIRFPRKTGMDEGIPTDERDRVAKKIKTEATNVESGIQSGLRASTDLSFLQPSAGPATGHSNAFPIHGQSRGSSNTKGQAAAHDVRRTNLPKNQHWAQQVVNAHARDLESRATGPALMTSAEITGGRTNHPNALPIEPPTAKNKPFRVSLSRSQHERREHSKKRGATFAKQYNLIAPYSPERTEIQPSGTGGGYMAASDIPRPSSPSRSFGGNNNNERAANSSSYLMGPYMHGSESHHETASCTHCGAAFHDQEQYCPTCAAFQ